MHQKVTSTLLRTRNNYTILKLKHKNLRVWKAIGDDITACIQSCLNYGTILTALSVFVWNYECNYFIFGVDY